jgi:hypothetical protein
MHHNLISIVFFFLLKNIHLILCKYLFSFKGKVKNKAHIETSICEAYIIEEISIFILYYFMPRLRTRINYFSRHDDGVEVPSSENLSIFFHPGRPVYKKNIMRGR